MFTALLSHMVPNKTETVLLSWGQNIFGVRYQHLDNSQKKLKQKVTLLFQMEHILQTQRTYWLRWSLMKEKWFGNNN